MTRRRGNARPDGHVVSHAPRDRGSASIWVLAIGLLVTLIGLGCVAVGRAAVASHQAQLAADMGALAGAGSAIFGDSIACARAAQVVGDNGGAMSGCVVDGLDVVVTARVEVTMGPVHGVATASARAGPERALELMKRRDDQVTGRA